MRMKIAKRQLTTQSEFRSTTRELLLAAKDAERETDCAALKPKAQATLPVLLVVRVQEFEPAAMDRVWPCSGVLSVVSVRKAETMVGV